MAEPYIGEIRLVAFNYAPAGWALCEGQTLTIAQNQALYSLLLTYYGGDGQTNFKLPDLRGRVMMGMGNDSTSGTDYLQGQTIGSATVALQPTQIPTHTHDVLAASDTGTKMTPASNYLATVPTAGANAYVTAPTQSSQQANMNAGMVAISGSSAPHSNMQPYTTVNAIIALQGYYPRRGDFTVQPPEENAMDSDAYIGEIRLFAGTFAPEGWLLCNGALMAINDYQILFSVIGVTYGGDGRTNFAVPDLRGRIPVCMNTDSTAQPTMLIGSMGGSETVAISENNLPSHNHIFGLSTALATSPAPTPSGTMTIGAGPSTSPLNLYTTTQKTITPGMLANQTIGISGSSDQRPHANVMPSLAITYIICNNGTFPTKP